MEPARVPAARSVIVAGLAGEGIAVVRDFLPAADDRRAARRGAAPRCRGYCSSRPAWAAGAARTVREDVRGDRVGWLDEGDAGARRSARCSPRSKRCALACNRELTLGLWRYEGHYALYPPGARYARHRDRFRDDDARVLSVVLYLNEAWQRGRRRRAAHRIVRDGGCARRAARRRHARRVPRRATSSTRCCRRRGRGSRSPAGSGRAESDAHGTMTSYDVALSVHTFEPARSRSRRANPRSRCGRPSTSARGSRRSIPGARSSCSASRRRATRSSTSRSPTSAARGCSSRSSRSRWPTAAPTSPSTRSRTCRWTCRRGSCWRRSASARTRATRSCRITTSTLAGLPGGARVGTSSLRREAQLRERDALLQVLPLRGNVNTRLRKLDEGRYDAIILAAAGLKRLGFAERIASLLDPEESLPAVGQGALALECRAGSHRRRRRARAARRSRHDARDDGRARVLARAVGELPHAARRARGVAPRRAVAARPRREPRRREVMRGERSAAVADAAAADALGVALAREFLARGAAAADRARTLPDCPWRLAGAAAPASASWSRGRRDRPARSRRSSRRSARAPIIFPAIAILPPADPAPLARAHAALDDYDFAIFVSANAVEYGAPTRDAGRRRSSRSRPARERRRRSPPSAFADVRIPATTFDSEGLLALPELAAPQRQARRRLPRRRRPRAAGRHAARAGRDGRLRRLLSARRAGPGAAGLVEAFRDGRIDAVTITSSEGLDNLWALGDEATRARWRARPTFVPHPRIAAHARELGLAVVETAGGDAGLIAGLLEWAAATKKS